MPEVANQPATGTDKEKRKQEVAQYRKDLQADIDEHKADQFDKIGELEDMGGSDVFDGGILAIVKRSGPGGISAAQLHKVFADAQKLTQARIRLVNNGQITAEKAGMTHLLKLTKVAAPAAPQTAGGKIIDVIAEVVA